MFYAPCIQAMNGRNIITVQVFFGLVKCHDCQWVTWNTYQVVHVYLYIKSTKTAAFEYNVGALLYSGQNKWYSYYHLMQEPTGCTFNNQWSWASFVFIISFTVDHYIILLSHNTKVHQPWGSCHRCSTQLCIVVGIGNHLIIDYWGQRYSMIIDDIWVPMRIVTCRIVAC